MSLRSTARRLRGPRLLAGGLAVALAGSVAAVVAAAPAAAATPGTYVVGTTPIALNQPADPYLGTLQPAADAATAGMFGPQMAWPVIPLHAVVARNGHLVTYGTPLGTAQQGGLT
ncbi:hypothetical protein SAMN05660199_01793 [Klenkia soli]|uniref:Uncharacterized protein n=1 Tax=Klenkia soli TaxID=1052260 RepID=A0A1H0IWM0_9ACTN|nr:hypothetical protein [Klenkia soli]SDO35743.1 hypothetical protein SAMN05660199_01793 [Klenkia soli]